MNVGTLSIVATPIGNMEDITLRALRVLKEVDYVLCEDTRLTGNLLKHHGISAKLKRYDAHASERTHEAILTDLESGTHIALVSDAGTPGVSDPGVLLVSLVRERIPTVRIEAIPGPSAITAAFSIAGISGNSFAFLGFVPHKKGRVTFFRELSSYHMPVMFYESTHRILKTLEALQGLSGTHRLIIARELTKIHEEVVSGTPSEIRAYFKENPEHVRGEFVIIVVKN